MTIYGKKSNKCYLKVIKLSQLDTFSSDLYLIFRSGKFFLDFLRNLKIPYIFSGFQNYVYREKQYLILKFLQISAIFSIIFPKFKFYGCNLVLFFFGSKNYCFESTVMREAENVYKYKKGELDIKQFSLYLFRNIKFIFILNVMRVFLELNMIFLSNFSQTLEQHMQIFQRQIL